MEKKKFKKVREWQKGVITNNVILDALLCWIIMMPVFIVVAFTFPLWYPILQSKVYYEEVTQSYDKTKNKSRTKAKHLNSEDTY